MKRNILFVTVSMLFIPLDALHAGDVPKPVQPNIIIILTDDQG